MASIVTIECFKGFHLIAQDCYGSERLQSFIDDYEYSYLCRLLGSELTELLIADLVDGVPQDPDYLEWFNRFCGVTESCCSYEYVESRGIKDMLLGFIYYEYTHDNQMFNSKTGIRTHEANNSLLVDMYNAERHSESRYNRSVESFNAISAKLGKCNKMKYKFLDVI